MDSSPSFVVAVRDGGDGRRAGVWAMPGAISRKDRGNGHGDQNHHRWRQHRFPGSVRPLRAAYGGAEGHIVLRELARHSVAAEAALH